MPTGPGWDNTSETFADFVKDVTVLAKKVGWEQGGGAKNENILDFKQLWCLLTGKAYGAALTNPFRFPDIPKWIIYLAA